MIQLVERKSTLYNVFNITIIIIFLLLTFPTAGRWQWDIFHLKKGLHIITIVFCDSFRPMLYINIFRKHFTKAHNKQNKTENIIIPGIHRGFVSETNAFNS